MTSYKRDYLGYGATPPRVVWPGDARVAVSFVINVEEGSEYSVRRGDAVNDRIFDMTADPFPHPDVAMESHFDFGPRVGYWRIARLLEKHGVPATLSATGETAGFYPWLFRDAVDRGHEIAAHGWRWEGHQGLTEAEERERIARTVDALGAVAGVPPVGWHTRTAASPRTRDLLIEHGGFLYDSDAYDDELPRIVEAGATPHVIMPYALDTNDMRFQLPNGFRDGAEFGRYLIAAYDWLHEEGTETPRMMSVGLHLRIIARPARIGGLAMFLEHIAARQGAWVATRRDIARHWLETVGQQEDAL
ncbi:polysaccharide deacetylase family protein [Breoghania sp. L-A4]|uniref:polysaccharide deacetylase family protein n=1 Tax=Breoghania sp. L-A4 TaxID=2304600 RepID=UPI000E35A4F6|nr:polysaccharide deacetylase family protein [Breoghania sp. L-A4]AXS41518.1 chitin deacetylase [Breoghania sp. L-A4]